MFRIFGQRKPGKSTRRKKGKDRQVPTDPTAALEKFIVEEIEVKAVPDRLTTGPQTRRYAAWRPALRRIVTQAGLWAMLLLAGLFSRSLWPVDETRFAAMAWEMWSSRQWLLPSLNGAVEPVAPLYLWATAAGWTFLGPVDWWLRLLPPVFGLASLLLVARLARRLWPEENLIRQYVPVVTLGTLSFAVLLGFALPMLMLVFFVLLGWWAQLVMWRARDGRAWLMLGAALGAGVLAHGPVALIYMLSPALLAPIWAKQPTRPRWSDWYRDVGKAIVLGAATVTAWLAPAAIKAGGGFTVGFLTRVVSPQLSTFMPPGHYVWWYLFLLPFVFLPWFVWPLPWLRLLHIRREPTDPGIAFCMTATIPTIVLLSLFAVKQPMYLLPILPAGALMISYLLLKDDLLTVDQDRALAGMTIPLILIGCGLAILPKLPRVDFLPPQLWNLSPFVGVTVVLVGIALAFLPLHEIRQRVQNLAILSVTSVVIGLLTLGSQLDPLYRVDETAAFVASLEREQHPIAIVGPYAGEYHYAGRLREPIQVLAAEEVEQWFAWHPQGVLIADVQRWQPRTAIVKPLHQAQRFDAELKAWDAMAVGAVPPGAGSGEAHRQ